MKSSNLVNLAKFVFIILLVFLVGYVIYVRPEKFNTSAQISENEAGNLDNSDLTLRDSIVNYAVELLGTPYVVAGNGRDGFDCSGYVYFVYQHFDIDIPRSTSAFENHGTEIHLADVKKGDLLLFLSPTRNAIGHIGIVSTADGPDSEFIHATSGREMKVVITNLSNEGYTRRFVKAIRVL